MSLERLSLLTAQRERLDPVTILATRGSPDHGAAQLLVQTATDKLCYINATPALIRRLLDSMYHYGKKHPTGLRLTLRNIPSKADLGIPLWDVLPYDVPRKVRA